MGDRERVTVRMAWMQVHPQRMWQMRFWKRVGQRVRSKGVRHADLVKVKQIIQEVERGYR